ncbi:hypothetical protein OIV83_002757 [Microbotryomycetes sp. JL201]|nr:hypothetical protein OIV83_002757 [Microbotryomycetes sp. JL201]
MSSPIPTATFVLESAVINASPVWPLQGYQSGSAPMCRPQETHWLLTRHHAMSYRPSHAQSLRRFVCVLQPLAKVWHLIKPEDFAKWWTSLKSSSVDKGTTADTDVYTWTFQDGTKQQVKMEEHSAIRHSITLSVVSSEPALTYSSVLSTITLWAVTTGEAENSTFVQFSGQFSSDADAGVIEDARFKRKEALADLAKAVAKA